MRVRGDLRDTAGMIPGTRTPWLSWKAFSQRGKAAATLVRKLFYPCVWQTSAWARCSLPCTKVTKHVAMEMIKRRHSGA